MDPNIVERSRFERLVTIHLPEPDIARAKEKAARKLSRDRTFKGFRPGKAPLRVVEAAVGAAALREEAIELALPAVVGQALEVADLRPAVTPRVENVRDEGDDVEVDVVVTLWPTLDRLPVYEGRKVTVTPVEVTEDEVGEQLDRLRTQFAELETVKRPAGEGSFALIDISATLHGRPVDDVSARDLLYEVGSRSFLDGLDETLTGKSAGDIERFTSRLPEGFGEHGGEEVTLQVLVKEVRKRRLPELTDEWVSDVTEFDSIEELRAELHSRVAEAKRRAAFSEYRSRVLADVLEDVDLEVPEGIVQAEMESQLHDFVHRLEERGIAVADYLQVTGQTQQAFVAEVREQAERSLRSRILLDAVADGAGLEVGPDEVSGVVEALATAAGVKVDEYRSALENAGQVESLTGDILRRKALDHLAEQAVAVDADGNQVDLAPIAEAVPGEVEVAAGPLDGTDDDGPAEKGRET